MFIEAIKEAVNQRFFLTLLDNASFGVLTVVIGACSGFQKGNEA